MNPHLGHFFAQNRRFMAFSEVSLPALYDLRELRRPNANCHGLCFGLSKTELSDTSAICYQLYTTAKKAFRLFLIYFTPNVDQKRHLVIAYFTSYLQH